MLPWEQFGRTSNGALKFSEGAIRVPRDITRVKLLAGHSPSGIPVGHATSWESRPEGLHMTFQFGSSDDATRALQAASDRVIDAFSIEAYGIEAEGTTVKSSILSAVALVPMPAFANARVATVTASAPSPSDGDDADTQTDETDNSTDETETETTTPPASPSDDDEDTDNDQKEDDMHLSLIHI